MGPIPAYAGEPMCGASQGGISGAYPRVCGGTVNVAMPTTRDEGLSPRMRGNQARTPLVPQAVGPIPAYAGEPCNRGGGRADDGAYPRVCGGTVMPPVGI